MGYETVMVNCNPETVSTDYSTSDRLYFEPLTPEDVAEVIAAEQAACVDGARVLGVIVSLGGQTPLKLSHSIDPALVLGTPVAVDRRGRGPRAVVGDLHVAGTAPAAGRRRAQPRRGPGHRARDRLPGAGATELRARRTRDGDRLRRRVAGAGDEGPHQRSTVRWRARAASRQSRPILIDSFLEDAIEVDVDAVRDVAGDVFVAGVMEHVEEAGVHSGDSACALPPQTLSDAVLATLHSHTRKIADALGVVGLINVQYAVKDEEVFVLEANPRASRTVPFVAKATGVRARPDRRSRDDGPDAARPGRLRASCPPTTPVPTYVSVKEAVLPFNRFPGVDTVLGPEMRSTGEVMGVGESFGIAFAKAQLAAGTRLPDAGQVFMSLADRDKVQGLETRATAGGPGLHDRRDGRHGGLPARARRRGRHAGRARSAWPRWASTPSR